MDNTLTTKTHVDIRKTLKPRISRNPLDGREPNQKWEVYTTRPRIRNPGILVSLTKWAPSWYASGKVALGISRVSRPGQKRNCTNCRTQWELWMLYGNSGSYAMVT